ncbi:response regulator [Fibrella forsythiae]|uniref:Response regulator n=1 Tax=Fibrella forsythiae TaxID=2817061 RepID=A0ABS3JSG7_9BACT|nr:response regulator [Fibrella forsythiae]MBO0952945.1 response regulator [Fibrella forsythiae]
MNTPNLVCVVDDNEDYLFLLQSLFHRWLPTYQVRCFVGGQAFVNVLPQLESAPGLILLDRHMPVMNGHQTLEHIRRHPLTATTPVVMMSALASAHERAGCYRSGANSFLLKPLDLMSMKDTLTLLCHYWLEVNQ